MAITTRRNSILRRYCRGLILDAFKLTFFVIVGAQAIFLSNVVVADLLPEVMEHQAGAGSLAALIVLTVPGVMVIALPLAVLVASYLVIMNRRSMGEFASLAGMGYSSKALLQLTLGIGVGAFLGSHIVSGYAEPVSRYQLAKTLFSVRNDALSEGRIASGEFNSIGDYVVFAQAGRFSDTAQGLFIHERADDAARVITADRSIQLPSQEYAGLGLVLRNASVYQFKNAVDAPVGAKTCGGCGGEEAEIMLSDQMYLQLKTPEISQLGARRSRSADMTNLELLRFGTPETEASAIIAERLLRDILCLAAPFVALLAATWTTSRTYLFAFPLAGGLVLAAQFLGTFAAKSLGAVGLAAMLSGMAVLIVIVGVALSALITRREAGLIQPLDLKF